MMVWPNGVLMLYWIDLLKEKINFKGICRIIAVVIGMLFIVGIITPEGLTLDLDPKYSFGNAIAFASGVAYGLYLFFSRYREDCDSNVRSWWNFLFGSLSIVVLLIWHHFFLQPLAYTEKINGVTQFDADGQIITHAWNMFTMNGSSWAVLIAAALITGFGAFYLLTFATKRLKAGELAAISYQETIMASLLGLIMFGEVMTTFQLIGGALIIIGGVAQIFFSTKAANENADDVEAGAAVPAQVGAGGAGFIDPTPDGMDPKLEAMAEAAQEAADDYDSKHPKE